MMPQGEEEGKQIVEMAGLFSDMQQTKGARYS
jgi:hypothetical protein